MYEPLKSIFGNSQFLRIQTISSSSNDTEKFGTQYFFHIKKKKKY